MGTTGKLSKKQIADAKEYCTGDGEGCDPRVAALVDELIGRVADKWTMLVIEALTAGGTMRFTRIVEALPGISQKMLTQTLRAMERDGLVLRTVHPVVPPHVDYALTPMGDSLGEAFCGVWKWAGRHLEAIEAARRAFDAKRSS
ncbi:MAG: helix-turn-helix transcriptional regulator [Planctomycetes bacterium]|nr:helix-turn-helix transcriptional regulator [Planctomycetota bacterium]